MPLIQCRDCGKTISDQSANCVGCGCPVLSIPKPTSPSGAASETVFYENADVRVTSHIVKIKERAYSPSLINSVGIHEVPNPKNVTCWIYIASYAFAAGSVGLIALGMGFFGFGFLMLASGELIEGIGALVTIGIAVGFGYLCLFLYRHTVLNYDEMKSLRVWGRIDFDTASGRKRDIITTEYITAKEIASAITELIESKNKGA